MALDEHCFRGWTSQVPNQIHPRLILVQNKDGHLNQFSQPILEFDLIADVKYSI